MLRWLTVLSPACHNDRAADFSSFSRLRRGPPSPQQPKKMGENTSFVAIKYIFFGFNVFVWLLGCGVLALGIWLQVNRGPFLSLVPSYTFLSASALCITAGAIILVVGFLGCCGAFLENQCMLVGYFVLVLLIFALQITAGTIGFIKKAEVKRLIKNELLVSIRKEYTLASHNQHKHGWVNIIDDVQRQLRCCGVNNHTDWFRVNAWPEEDRVPVSCCEQEVVDCETKGPWHGRGCLGEMEYWFIRNMYVLGVVGITVGVIQILGIIAAIIMFCYLRSRKFLL